MKEKRVISNLLLVLTAFIWGTAFVAQRVGMDFIQPFTFNAVRNMVATVAMLPVILFLDYYKNKNAGPKLEVTVGARKGEVDIKDDIREIKGRRRLLLSGFLCGVAMFVASAFQQIGIIYTTVGKSGFITALYIVIVPVLGIFLKKKVPVKVWISVVIALFGLYLLCINEGLSINIGDLLTLGCAFTFSLHILIVDYFSPKVDGVKMSCIQFFVCSIFSFISAIIFEKISIEGIIAATVPILYTGVLSSSVAYTLQIIAQKNTEPTVASLIMSLESVFAVLAGWLVLNQILLPKEIAGCVLVFIAITLTQLPMEKMLKKSKI